MSISIVQTRTVSGCSRGSCRVKGGVQERRHQREQLGIWIPQQLGRYRQVLADLHHPRLHACLVALKEWTVLCPPHSC